MITLLQFELRSFRFSRNEFWHAKADILNKKWELKFTRLLNKSPVDVVNVLSTQTQRCSMPNRSDFLTSEIGGYHKNTLGKSQEHHRKL